MLDWLRRRRGGSGAAKQQGDVHALDRDDDPRGGTQSDTYRHAAPEDVVEEGDTVMGGPGGTPQNDDATADERRDRDRSD